MKTIIAALCFAVAGSAAAIAHANQGGGLEGWQAEQMERIEAGRQSGAITWSEGNQLRAEQRNILKTRQRLEADGQFSPEDRRTFRRMLIAADANITQHIHDGRRRIWWLPRFGR